MENDERQKLFNEIVEHATEPGDYLSDEYYRYIESLDLRDHYDVAELNNKLDSAIISKLNNENVVVEEDSLIDKRNKVTACAGYYAAVSHIAKIAGIDRNQFLYLLSEAEAGNFVIVFSEKIKKMFDL